MSCRKVLVLLLIATALWCFVHFDLGRFLTLEALKANRERLLAYKEVHPAAMVGGFMALYILQTAFSFPGAALLSLAAGALFGAIQGTVYAVISATLGATLACLVTRYLLREAVQARFGARLAGVERELESRGLHYLLFLRLVPIFPFFLINLAAGLTRLPLRTFIVGTLIGIIPGGFVYVNAGASLASVNRLEDVLSARVLGAFTLLGLLALAPAIYAKLRHRQASAPRRRA